MILCSLHYRNYTRQLPDILSAFSKAHSQGDLTKALYYTHTQLPLTAIMQMNRVNCASPRWAFRRQMVELLKL